jgi:hypothetical protein
MLLVLVSLDLDFEGVVARDTDRHNCSLCGFKVGVSLTNFCGERRGTFWCQDG